ncbi:hypothetical protein TrLO_g14200 [Triparma laevis f. longispina]|uniref:D-glutamate cyclase-like C-terminal domain-containing protein n=1 Tax=Triparma laevis f. longispina TaxID=1714387 RepID=A0A9W7C6D7_9STRA|nr:hypothetical protein TrLO_g14200 [Triparma laevis f. longispina]
MDAQLGIMAFLITSIVSRQFATALKPRNSVLNQPTFRRSISTSAALSKIEERIGRGEGGRGIEEIVIRGEFTRACEHLARLPQNSTVVILSGFPCCIDRSPPSETDGPPGAFSIARSAVALGLNALILTDECNEDVFISGAAAVGDWAGGGRLTLESFPPENEWGEDEAKRLIEIVEERCDHVVAIERPGRAKDGSCYTMRGISMDHLLAPLDKVIDLAKQKDAGIVVTAIGDGGNELGMGKVYGQVLSSKKILMPEKCVSVIGCDNLIVSSVSNWGGFALAAGAGVVRWQDTKEEGSCAGMVQKCLQSLEEETKILDFCVKAGCRDGVSGEMESTVDGMSLKISLDCLEEIHEICGDVL